MRIVLCDDDHTCCKKYTWLLRKIKEEYSLDFTIEICNNGKQLLFLSEDLLSSDIILLDIMMPGMGWDCSSKTAEGKRHRLQDHFSYESGR